MQLIFLKQVHLIRQECSMFVVSHDITNDMKDPCTTSYFTQEAERRTADEHQQSIRKKNFSISDGVCFCNKNRTRDENMHDGVHFTFYNVNLSFSHKFSA